jgi:hypothetical protein
MTDLAEAGRRLAATQVGPTPPLHALEARRTRRARRRRLVAGGSVTLAVAAAILLIVALTNNASRPERVVTAPPPSRPTSSVTLPQAPSVGGSVAYDYLRLRLWLPSGWTTSTSTCHSTNQVVYFPANYSSGPALSCTLQLPSDTVVVLPFHGSIAASTVQTRVNGFAVSKLAQGPASSTWEVPSLQVQLVVSGGSAQKVAGTLEASPLQEILTGSFPTPVPSTWQSVTLDGFQARVPAGWPTHQIVVTTTGNSTSIAGLPPGVCGPPVFHVPSVYLGANPGISCPPILETKDPPTDDGLWLQTSSNTVPLSTQLGTSSSNNAADPQRLVSIGTAQALISAQSGDSVYVEIDAAGKRIDAVIGLGPNPAIAEAILSSITPTVAH